MKSQLTFHRKTAPLLAFFLSTLLFTACKKDHTGTQAKGSLQNIEGNCLPGTPHGKWTVGLTPGDSSYVEVTVHVTQPGTYHIQSDSSNGVQFSDSGTFTNTGDQLIRLKPKGYFDTARLTLFNISFDNSFCGFALPVDTLPALTSDRWRFTANGRLYQGTTEGHLWFLPNQLGSILEFNQEVFGSSDTVLDFQIVTPYQIGGVTPGTYHAGFSLNAPGGQLMQGSQGTLDGADVIATLLGAIFPPPAGTRQYIGTFSGPAVDPRTGEIIQVRNGEFHTGA